LDYQNLAYGLTQIAHNFGAVAVVGGAISALVWRDAELHRRLAWIVLTGWLVQAVSGATFGAISYYYYSKFPDIHGVAVAALRIKMVSAALGFSLAGLILIKRPADTASRKIWLVLCLLGILALCSAAILRWFS